MEKNGFASDLEAGDWFREHGRIEPLWYVNGVAERGDDICVSYSAGPDDAGEPSEAVYDASAIISIQRNTPEH